MQKSVSRRAMPTPVARSDLARRRHVRPHNKLEIMPASDSKHCQDDAKYRQKHPQLLGPALGRGIAAQNRAECVFAVADLRFIVRDLSVRFLR
jgi:hypothetical protein